MSLWRRLWFANLKQMSAMHYYDSKLKQRSRELRKVLRCHDRNVKRDIVNVLRCIPNWIEQSLRGKAPQDIPLKPS